MKRKVGRPRGSSVFEKMDLNTRVIAFFLIKMFRLDENDAQDVNWVLQYMSRVMEDY